MTNLVHELVRSHARRDGGAPALIHGDSTLTYAEFDGALDRCAQALLGSGIGAGERVAVYLPKHLVTVIGIFAASCAGATFVPINPALKPKQVAYILKDCGVRVLITAGARWQQLGEAVADCDALHTVVLADAKADAETEKDRRIVGWDAFLSGTAARDPHRRIDGDVAAILYTSGSTGNPKGVVLSHRNLVAGAESVSTYLENTPTDRILAVLPLSFDAGLSQLTTAFSVGASVVLMDYLLPRDVLRAVAKYRCTGLAAVPPLWNQLVQLEWPEEVATCLRYITNTGGAMPVPTTRRLRALLPDTRIYLMYGLTEAFRSTYLPPEEVDERPESIGKAVPNAEILVVKENGEPCGPGEPGELVHRGALVALGYWNDPEKTAQRFRPCPSQDPALPLQELAVWSGDQVVRDEDGYLYFVARKDDMIKTSGYRVSPTEVEAVAYASGLVGGAVALGLYEAVLGQAILLIVTAGAEEVEDHEAIADELSTLYRRELPNFMQPREILVRDALPHNQNGKIDRRSLAEEYADRFRETGP
ncbi:MAG: acyl-CoA ligase (AMP-forming), exosortase A system-associated [Halieaceae bacterium]|jgi:acyl-CoA ligase (AMP-forming) (exosortase A-associated)|nr:acyl-CoA ligase (AMP-forming), exosortase A system-associated [Halieaceae bacterium]